MLRTLPPTQLIGAIPAPRMFHPPLQTPGFGTLELHISVFVVEPTRVDSVHPFFLVEVAIWLEEGEALADVKMVYWLSLQIV